MTGSVTSTKTSFSQRAFNYFKGTTQTFTNIQVAPGVFNKNLKMFMSKKHDENEQPSDLPTGLNDKKGKH